MISLDGGSALSGFRKKKLLSTLAHNGLNIIDLEAHYVHFVDTSAALTTDEHSRLVSLLQDNTQLVESVDSIHSDTTQSFLSVPRIGTITPWSTKATDIANRCGLQTIKRIERGIRWQVQTSSNNGQLENQLATVLTDPMTETLLSDESEAQAIFGVAIPTPFVQIDILGGGLPALQHANKASGFALSDEEQVYLVEQFTQLGRNPTDAELMMFAQVNSEHCRHKIFNADWSIDGKVQSLSPFKMIKHTHQENGENTLVAYHDNAAVIKGATAGRFFPDPSTGQYRYHNEGIHIAIKVETHNHPTAISPFPGAATGSGGEIRDEGATGRGGKPKVGLTGFSVSHLRLPDSPRVWEAPFASPSRIASPLQIMLEGPVGGASFNNEFGRPNLCGYFRTFEHSEVSDSADAVQRRGYHKPIMLAGGLGNIREQHIDKIPFDVGAVLIVLGGPAMLIGLGGGAASSVASGSSSEQLDFASVQRGNPEMQRRCQEVIDTCWARGEDNPILWLHDVGAGGLSNALPELVEDSNRSGHFDLRKILNDDLAMSPMQIWCNESQERYVMAIAPESLADFEAACQRERALYAVVGHATNDGKLVLEDQHFAAQDSALAKPIDLPMEVLFGLPPKMARNVSRKQPNTTPLNIPNRPIEEVALDILRFPAVADKTFLISIGDRSITGLIARDQMVGPWQVPVADVAVSLSGFDAFTGEAMSIGERTPLALINAAASGRMAIGEALTNISAASISNISDIKLSANWMVPAGEPGEDANLYDTVHAIAMVLCPALGISIPVGKDSMSMQTVWGDKGQHKVVSPLSLVVSAFAPVEDARRTLTPQLNTSLNTDKGDKPLWLIDLGAGQNRLGGSVYAQIHSQMGDQCPDVDSAAQLKGFFNFIQSASQQGWLLAYHDRSDGGLMATLAEMAFTSRCGLQIDLPVVSVDAAAALFNEELGAVIQLDAAHAASLMALAGECGISNLINPIGQVGSSKQINISCQGDAVFSASRVDLHRAWSETTWKMQSLRDNPACAQQEYDRLLDKADSGLFSSLGFDANERPVSPMINKGEKPKIAILREQGVNGQIEMAAAFDRAEFDSIDVTMSDLAEGRKQLNDFQGFVACGGFSFGDVLGAGEGWAKSILFNPLLRDQFADYFQRDDRFALGVCNGCQMLSTLSEIIPGSEHWPRFVRNQSEQFEGRYVMAKVMPSASLFFNDMEGSILPVAVAHGEGRAQFTHENGYQQLAEQYQQCLQFVDYQGKIASLYPANPNGSPEGLTGITNSNGLVTLMMPHPERTTRTVNHSWAPEDWDELSPWMRMFYNARQWVS
ncbi:MAG: phosphoribosylformylglycinamidine synthase [Saprospiraceae bacterium]|jgi:phosphoribosylformylglycinamidine synthase